MKNKMFVVVLICIVPLAEADMVPITEMVSSGQISQHRYVTQGDQIKDLYNQQNYMIPKQVIGYIADRPENNTSCLYVVKANFLGNHHQLTYLDPNITKSLEETLCWRHDAPLGCIYTQPGKDFVPLYTYDGQIDSNNGDQILSTKNIPWMIVDDTVYTQTGMLGYVYVKPEAKRLPSIWQCFEEKLIKLFCGCGPDA